MGDAITVHRMLENLLANAAKYAPDGPIEISVTAEAELAVVEVVDHGPGIPEAERDYVLRAVRPARSRSRDARDGTRAHGGAQRRRAHGRARRDPWR